ncbi:methylthioribulose-1-phosphate dehydratase [Collibacillus ludicampi]|uniref:Methylthioribulose-1-phosphate dehydratase n=1 Tax=Collibacillus ludicampi TaxID=2771369 RepID=A0AAV4LAQ4_9BACL|nr:methylthioribulose 1-phosphate dehydratase [Collibacillus ludicampi]GIM44836.1 methylthioribulose-1-phosphate dehydratase [Collibacillus ludicampi]
MSQYLFYQEDRIRVVKELNEIAHNFSQKGWLPATSGNLSISLCHDPLVFGVTASGRDKENLQLEDIVFVKEDCSPIEPTRLKPSAETLIHAKIYQLTGAGSVLHVHTVYNNLISEIYAEEKSVVLSDMELIKGLNIWEEGAAIEIPIIENYADIPRLAEEIGKRIHPQVPGVLIRKHGIYAWGEDSFSAKRHVEAFEFMFQYHFLWLGYVRTLQAVEPAKVANVSIGLL